MAEAPTDCDPTRASNYQPSDRTPTPDDLRHAEIHDSKDQHAGLVQLYRAHTITVGSYL